MTGTVSMLLVELGERVAGTSLMAGTELMRIADLSSMEAQVEVNENDIVRVTLGDTAIISIDAYLNRKFKGVVTEIASSAKTTGVSADQVTNFDVKILVFPESYQDLTKEGDRNPLRPGMSTTVDIQTETRESVIAVPIQSVTTRTDTTKVILPAAKRISELYSTDDERHCKGCYNGIRDNSYIEILSVS